MYVYILRSLYQPQRHYVGITIDLKRRLLEHNAGKSHHTSKFRPWKYVVAVWVENEQKARTFERYLKSASGRAFSKKHFA
jgi:putative endonuclease